MKLKLLLATRNRDKIREIHVALHDLGAEILSAADMPELPEIIEDADSLAGNAVKKAQTLYHLTGIPAIADDTGLEVMALHGAPGILSARYSGPNATYFDNVRKLLHNMAGIPAGKRQAQFRTVVAFAYRGGVEKIEGVCHGEITTEPRGEGNFGYDPIFFVPESGKTLAEMSLAEKNEVSHRGQALRKLRDFLQTLEPTWEG